MLGHQRGVVFGGVNAYNFVKRARMLLSPAKYVPSVVRCASNLYARALPKLLFRRGDGRARVVHSRTGIEQGCVLGHLRYSTAGAELLREFRRNLPVECATVCRLIDDLAVELRRR